MASKPATCVCCGVCRLCTYTTHAHSRVAHARAFSALVPFHWYVVETTAPFHCRPGAKPFVRGSTGCTRCGGPSHTLRIKPLTSRILRVPTNSCSIECVWMWPRTGMCSCQCARWTSC